MSTPLGDWDEGDGGRLIDGPLFAILIWLRVLDVISG